MVSCFQAIAGREHTVRERPKRDIDAQDDAIADDRRAIRMADEAEAETVDKIKEGIEMGDELPWGWTFPRGRGC